MKGRERGLGEKTRHGNRDMFSGQFVTGRSKKYMGGGLLCSLLERSSGL